MSAPRRGHVVPAGRLGRSAGTGVAGGAVATLAVWILSRVGVEVPPEVASAGVTVVAWLLAVATPEPAPAGDGDGDA